jgi:hypothetical protein
MTSPKKTQKWTGALKARKGLISGPNPSKTLVFQAKVLKKEGHCTRKALVRQTKLPGGGKTLQKS